MKKNFLILMFCIANLGFSRNTPPPPTGRGPVPVGFPIDAWVLPMLGVAILVSFYFFIQKKKLSNS